MSFIDDSIDVAKDLFDAAAKKTSETIDVSKIKYSIFKQKKSIETDYVLLGKLYYDSVISGEEIASTAGDLCELLTDKIEGLNELKDQLGVVQNRIICEKCGKSNARDAAFCNFCGNKF